MVGIILISESRTAKEMLNCVKKVMGKNALLGMAPLVIQSHFTSLTLKSKVNKLIKKLKADKGTLIMTELYGSTQSNICKDFLHKGEIEMVCGYNLPMIIKAATINKTATLSQVVTQTRETGKKYIKSFK